MKVFVTGGAGYIGSVCVEQLLAAGHEVTVYDNLGEGHRSAVDPRAGLVVGDLADGARLAQSLAASGARAVVHFAAYALVGESMQDPGRYFRNNVANGLNLLDACREANVGKIVFSSTCATYGLPEVVPITEDTPQRPINPYGESKLMFERMLEWYRRVHGIDYVALRYFNVAGASERCGEHHRVETHLVPNVLRVAAGRAAQCEVFGTDYPTPDGTCIRDYIHVEDLADAHVLALAPGASGAFNLGNGEGYSVRDVIAACERVTGRRIPTIERPRRPGDPPRLVAAATRARRELHWRPTRTTLGEMAGSAWRWMQRHPEGYPD